MQLKWKAGDKTSGTKSYISPKIKRGKSKYGDGLFAQEKINKGELVVDFTTGPGTFMTMAEADKLYEGGNDYMLQIDDDLYFVATNNEELEDADYLNHSCDPNCGLHDTLKVVAMRDIEPGEEIAFDYAMTDSSNYQMKCECGSPNCRKVITGDDWKLPELQKRYNGYFTEYLQEKIDKLNNQPKNA